MRDAAPMIAEGICRDDSCPEEFEKSTLFLIVFPVTRAVPGIIQVDISYTPQDKAL
jgi:hypothetical protein